MAVCSGLTVGKRFVEKVSQRIRTIIVDDSDAFLEITGHLIDFEAIDLVAAASDGVEAIGVAARLRPELVVMDVVLPGLDGLEVATLLSDMSPAPKVVLMSEVDTPELRAAGRRAGAFAVVSKGNFQQEFRQVLERIQHIEAVRREIA
jgi:CheY-like chemotaxis protein